MYVPTALIMDTGVLKKSTDVTMTTTRFTQFPTECVTGVTLDKIMYDTWRGTGGINRGTPTGADWPGEVNRAAIVYKDKMYQRETSQVPDL